MKAIIKFILIIGAVASILSHVRLDNLSSRFRHSHELALFILQSKPQAINCKIKKVKRAFVIKLLAAILIHAVCKFIGGENVINGALK